MLQKARTSEVREELSSSVSWNFRAFGVVSKTFYSSGVGFFVGGAFGLFVLSCFM